MSNIDPRDTVQVVRWPCCGGTLGAIFLVETVKTVGAVRCNHCQKILQGPVRVAIAWGDKAAPVDWLKRYRPLAELERGNINQESKTNG